MVKAIQSIPHILSDKIVAEGIIGINRVKEMQKVRGHLAGGMAVQSYTPKEAYRPTIDIDFRFFWKGGASEFRELVSPLVSYLQSRGYDVNFQKKGLTYEIVFKNKDDSLLMQHPRASPNCFNRNMKSLEREVANERVLSKFGINYSALSPEDLVVHKLSRVSIFVGEYGIALPSQLHDFSVEKLRSEADSIKTDVLGRLGEVSPQEIAKMRIYYDCFDIRCLASYAGLNGNYFDEIIRDWTKGDSAAEDKFKRTSEVVGLAIK